MSSAPDTSADEQLPVADLQTEITEALLQLLDGDAEDVRVTENGETIEIEIDVAPSTVEESEAVANAAPSYTQWLRSNSSRDLPPERDGDTLGETYSDWLGRHGRGREE